MFFFWCVLSITNNTLAVPLCRLAAEIESWGGKKTKVTHRYVIPRMRTHMQ
jgi:hypothetical protein